MWRRVTNIYSVTFQAPASADPLTMTVMATNVPGEIGTTNVIKYSVISLPPNDNFTNATKVPVAGGAYVANNRFATVESGEPYHDEIKVGPPRCGGSGRR